MVLWWIWQKKIENKKNFDQTFHRKASDLNEFPVGSTGKGDSDLPRSRCKCKFHGLCVGTPFLRKVLYSCQRDTIDDGTTVHKTSNIFQIIY